MKARFLIILVVTLVASTALAVPQTINYQGHLADSGGTPVNATVSMTFAIYNTPSGGAPLWAETQNSVMVTDGAFSVALGSFVPIALPFDEQYYLGVQVEADAEMTPRAVLVSVPYAMRAAEVDSIAPGGVTSDEIADGAVTGAKLSVPLALSSSSSISSTLSVEMTGTGDAFYANSSGVGHAVFGQNTGGSGCGGLFEINNPDSFGEALFAVTDGGGRAIYGLTTGTGRAGYFEINNAGNTQPALEATTTGNGYSGYFGGGQGVYVDGDLDVTGSITGDGSGLTNVGADVSAPLDLSGSVAIPGAIINAVNTGTGYAGHFWINNPAGDNDAFHAQTNGGGDAVVGSTIGAGNAVYGSTSGSGNAVYGFTGGTGGAGYFWISNPANNNHALYASTNGSGSAVYGYNYGTGYAGRFEINNPANNTNALFARTNGMASAGFFEILNAANGNHALYAQTNGLGGAGLFFINNTDNTFDALHAETDGTGYSGYFGGGQGVYVDGDLDVTGSITGDGSGLTDVPVEAHYHDADYVNVAGDTMTGTLFVAETGDSPAGHFAIDSPVNFNPVLTATTIGMGEAGTFEIGNPANNYPALSATTTGSGNAVYGYTTGTGRAGNFVIDNVSNASPALYATTNGTGFAGQFDGDVNVNGVFNATALSGDGSQLTNLSGTHSHDADYVRVTGDTMTGSLIVDSPSGTTIYGKNTGTGKAGWFVINNTFGTEDALYGTTNGIAGAAVHGYNTGAGWAGYFHVNNASNSNPALYAETNGSGDGVQARITTGGSGKAVSGYNTGTGGNAGYFLISNASNSSNALVATTSGGGYSGYFEGGAGVVIYGGLEVASGYTKLALTTGAPPAADCDQASERGRMKVDNVNGLLYICMNSGWVSK